MINRIYTRDMDRSRQAGEPDSLLLRRLLQAARTYDFDLKELSVDVNVDMEELKQEAGDGVEVVTGWYQGADDNQIVGEVFASESLYRMYQILIPAVFTVIIILGIIGNSLVIFVIASRKKLQTATNLLLLNLAVADVSFSVVCGGFSVVHYVLTEWPFGEAVCRLIQYLLYITCYVMVYTLMAVSWVRYLTVVHGIKANVYLTKRNICIVILGLWVVFIFAKIPVLMVHSVTYTEYTNRTECIIIGKQEAREFFATFFMFAYALPLLVICTMYLKVIFFLRKKYHVARTPTTTYAMEERKRHVTKIVALVVAVFAVCWLPLHIHLLVAYYGVLPETLTYKLLLIVWHSLVYIHSLLNPIIYHYFSEDFRVGFIDAVRCRSTESPTNTVSQDLPANNNMEDAACSQLNVSPANSPVVLL